LAAYIQQNQGLEIAAQRAAKEINTENRTIKVHKDLIDNLIVKTDKINKNFKKLTSTISE
jgi:hypothetical protein